MSQNMLNQLGAEVAWLMATHPDRRLLIRMGTAWLWMFKSLCGIVPTGFEEKHGPIEAQTWRY
jgi:hypothetical protein